MVGAFDTSKVVEKAMTLYRKHQGTSGSDSRSNLAEITNEVYDDFEEEFEDYIDMAINYLKEKCVNDGGNIN
jgi:hypothetical protein